jgi:hypothetical protein
LQGDFFVGDDHAHIAEPVGEFVAFGVEGEGVGLDGLTAGERVFNVWVKRKGCGCKRLSGKVAVLFREPDALAAVNEKLVEEEGVVAEGVGGDGISLGVADVNVGVHGL